MKHIKQFLPIVSLLFILIIIYYVFLFINKIINNYNKKEISNSLVILWDIHCKKNFLNYINENRGAYNLIHILEIGFIVQRGSNYIAFMTRHPQQYYDIKILYNEIIKTIKLYNLKNIISFSTAGSKHYKIGSVVQFASAIVQDPHDYDIDANFVKSNYILTKTTKYTDKSITDTKGFKNPSTGQYASGEDEFVIYVLSNKLKIPSITFTGISDNDNSKEYSDGGGDLAAKNAINYFLDNFYLN